MINAITKENFYTLLPLKVSQLVAFYKRHFKVSDIEAIKAIYTSHTYKKLAVEETKLWHYGPVALFQYYQEYR